MALQDLSTAMNVIPELIFLLFLGLNVRLLEIHDALQMLVLELAGLARSICAVSLPAIVVSNLLNLVLVKVTMDVQRGILLLQRFEIFVLERIGIDSHLIIQDIDVALPSLLVLVEVGQELLVVCVALAQLLLFLVVVAVVALADAFAHQAVLVVHIDVTSEPLDIDNLALALLADVTSPLKEPLLCTDIHLALSLLLESLIDQLTQLEQSVFDALGVLVYLPLSVYCNVGGVGPSRIAKVVSDLSTSALQWILSLRRALRREVRVHGGRKIEEVL